MALVKSKDKEEVSAGVLKAIEQCKTVDEFVSRISSDVQNDNLAKENFKKLERLFIRYKNPKHAAESNIACSNGKQENSLGERKRDRYIPIETVKDEKLKEQIIKLVEGLDDRKKKVAQGIVFPSIFEDWKDRKVTMRKITDEFQITKGVVINLERSVRKLIKEEIVRSCKISEFDRTRHDNIFKLVDSLPEPLKVIAYGRVIPQIIENYPEKLRTFKDIAIELEVADSLVLKLQGAIIKLIDMLEHEQNSSEAIEGRILAIKQRYETFFQAKFFDIEDKELIMEAISGLSHEKQLIAKEIVLPKRVKGWEGNPKRRKELAVAIGCTVEEIAFMEHDIETYIKGKLKSAKKISAREIKPIKYPFPRKLSKDEEDELIQYAESLNNNLKVTLKLRILPSIIKEYNRKAITREELKSELNLENISTVYYYEDKSIEYLKIWFRNRENLKKLENGQFKKYTDIVQKLPQILKYIAYSIVLPEMVRDWPYPQKTIVEISKEIKRKWDSIKVMKRLLTNLFELIEVPGSEELVKHVISELNQKYSSRNYRNLTMEESRHDEIISKVEKLNEEAKIITYGLILPKLFPNKGYIAKSMAHVIEETKLSEDTIRKYITLINRYLFKDAVVKRIINNISRLKGPRLKEYPFNRPLSREEQEKMLTYINSRKHNLKIIGLGRIAPLIITFKKFEAITQEEIADELGISVSTVSIQEERLFKILKVKFYETKAPKFFERKYHKDVFMLIDQLPFVVLEVANRRVLPDRIEEWPVAKKDYTEVSLSTGLDLEAIRRIEEKINKMLDLMDEKEIKKVAQIRDELKSQYYSYLYDENLQLDLVNNISPYIEELPEDKRIIAYGKINVALDIVEGVSHLCRLIISHYSGDAESETKENLNEKLHEYKHISSIVKSALKSMSLSSRERIIANELILRPLEETNRLLTSAELAGLLENEAGLEDKTLPLQVRIVLDKIMERLISGKEIFDEVISDAIKKQKDGDRNIIGLARRIIEVVDGIKYDRAKYLIAMTKIIYPALYKTNRPISKKDLVNITGFTEGGIENSEKSLRKWLWDEFTDRKIGLNLYPKSSAQYRA